MSPDEVIVTVGSAVVALVAWVRWYVQMATPVALGGRALLRPGMLITPPLCLLALFAMLRGFASHDVREAPKYLLMYCLLGAAWLAVFTWIMSLLGLSARDDVAERGNAAAVPALGGAMLGATAAYAGGNLGDGPGWWVVVFSAGLATVTVILVHVVLDRVAHVNERVTVERDASAGWRLGGLLLACGLICGRGAAGTWVAPIATVIDFVQVAWPVAPLALAEIVVSLVSPPRGPDRSALPGMFAGAMFVAVACLYLGAVGWWS